MSDDQRQDVILEKLSSMDQKMDNIRDVQKQHGEHLHNLDITVAKTEKDLSYHIKMYNDIREDLNEHKTENKSKFEQIQHEITPIKQQVNTSSTVFKWLLGGGGILGTVWMVIKILEIIKSVG